MTNGTVDVPLGALNPAAAYQLIVTPAGPANVPAVSPPATQQYLAANATLTGTPTAGTSSTRSKSPCS